MHLITVYGFDIVVFLFSYELCLIGLLFPTPLRQGLTLSIDPRLKTLNHCDGFGAASRCSSTAGSASAARLEQGCLPCLMTMIRSCVASSVSDFPFIAVSRDGSLSPREALAAFVQQTLV